MVFGRCFIEIDGKLTDIRDLSREQYKQFMKLMEDTNRIWWLLDQRQQMKERGDQPPNAVV